MSIKTVEGMMIYPQDNYINIAHNLASYPLIQVVYFDTNSFGVLPFGYHGFGDAITDNLEVKYEYINDNEIKINFSYKFKNPTNLTQVTTTKYTVNFDNGISATIYLK